MIMQVEGKLNPKSKFTYFPLTFRLMYPSRFFVVMFPFSSMERDGLHITKKLNSFVCLIKQN